MMNPFWFGGESIALINLALFLNRTTIIEELLYGMENMKPQRTNPAQKSESEDLPVLQNKYLIGWPGYRNARGRSGLGYVETQAEWAHMRGRIFRMLLERKVITRNPIFLIGMFIVGAIYSLPVVLGIPEILAGNTGIWMVLIINLPAWIFGVLLLNNVFISLFHLKNESDNTREDEE